MNSKERDYLLIFLLYGGIAIFFGNLPYNSIIIISDKMFGQSTFCSGFHARYTNGMDIRVPPRKGQLELLYGNERQADFPIAVRIWRGSLRVFKISVLQAIVLDVIRQHTQRFGFCAFPNDIFAANYKVSTGTISNAYSRLVKVGLIERVYPTKEERQKYWKNFESAFEDSQKSPQLRTSCYKITDVWEFYIEPSLGKTSV